MTHKAVNMRDEIREAARADFAEGVKRDRLLADALGVELAPREREIDVAKHNYRSLVKECGEIERQIYELAEQLEGVLEDRLAAAEYLRELGAWGEFEVGP